MAGEFLLVVDDEQLLLDTFRLVLEEAGHAVTCVDSVDKAERVLLEVGAQVKALVTDILLGGKKTGWDLAVRAREIDGDIPVVYVVGLVPPDGNTRRVPNSQILPKPFTSSQLVEAIDLALSTEPAPGATT